MGVIVAQKYTRERRIKTNRSKYMNKKLSKYISICAYKQQ